MSKNPEKPKTRASRCASNASAPTPLSAAWFKPISAGRRARAPSCARKIQRGRASTYFNNLTPNCARSRSRCLIERNKNSASAAAPASPAKTLASAAASSRRKPFMINPSIFSRNCSAILTPSLRFESIDCLNMIMLKMVEAITGMTRTYSPFSIPIPRAVSSALARTAAALLPIRSACFSRLSTRSVCHRAARDGASHFVRLRLADIRESTPSRGRSICSSLATTESSFGLLWLSPEAHRRQFEPAP
jgi:hypothetical protein